MKTRYYFFMTLLLLLSIGELLSVVMSNTSWSLTFAILLVLSSFLALLMQDEEDLREEIAEEGWTSGYRGIK